MNKKLYELMDWASMEAITYTEADKPKELLGAHSIKKTQTLVQAYYPDAVSMFISVAEGKYEEMDLADEAGFFATIIKKAYPFRYSLKAVLEDKTEIEYIDPYSFGQIITDKELERFLDGKDYNSYKILGAHLCTIGGIKGCHFALVAPNATRVSVVGDFNNWDGRFYQMQKISDAGVYEIFIPEIKAGALYKFEIRQKDNNIVLKPDPYAFSTQLRPDDASVVMDNSLFKWSDKEYLANRKNLDLNKTPIVVYELILSHFLGRKADGSHYSYKELAPKVISYVKKMGYTHIELLPIMEYLNEESLGYNTINYYSPSARYGSPDDFKYFVDQCHKNDIGLIMDVSFDHFPDDTNSLRRFDGSCIYEHEDLRKGYNPKYGTMIFNYGRAEVKSFLISSAIYFIREYHIDGIKLSSLGAMLYLDYDKTEDQYVPNVYGGKENLEAIEFIKELNTAIKKQSADVLSICYEDTAWSGTTGNVLEGGLGFDLKWNNGFIQDFLGYLSYDPLYRTHHYGELCFPLVYAFTEKFILNLSHEEFTLGKPSLISMMPGKLDEKMANLRAALGFYMTHPGKKLMFMGQDIGEFEEFDSNRAINWGLLDEEEHKKLQKYVIDLISLYKNEEALYGTDFTEKGFEWINCVSADENIIVFMRKSPALDKELVVVINFENIPRNNYKIGVPRPCKLKEIFNSDSESYGGFGFNNPRAKLSKGSECDGFDDSVKIKVPPLGMCVFEVLPLED